MSDTTTAVPIPSSSGSAPRRARSGLLAVTASVAAVVLVAGGGYAAWQALSGSGPRPADVLPQDTFALVSIDLDPSGGQKIEAIRTLRRFPAIREQGAPGEDGDPVRAVFEQIRQEGGCPGLDYAKDVRPWIGQRAGLGGVTLDGEPVPVGVLQVTDPDGARAGAERLLECAETEGAGAFVLTDDYLVVSDTRAHAEAIRAGGEKSPLTEDVTYQKWRDEVGGEGIVELYAAPEAAAYVQEALSGFGGELLGQDPAATGEELDKAVEDFRGGAAALRFDDGGIELSIASGGPDGGAEQVGGHVGDLPADTAALLAIAVPEQLREVLREGASDGPYALVGEALSQVGLSPDDVVTALGESVSLSVGGDAPDSVEELAPASVPLGLLVRGDPAEIEDVVARAEDGTGVSLSDLPAYVETGEDDIALASQEEYAAQLVEGGRLGDDEVFTSVVARADDARAVVFLRVDDQWRALLRDAVRQDASVEPFAENLDVVRALGFSAWSEGDTGHAELRIATR